MVSENPSYPCPFVKSVVKELLKNFDHGFRGFARIRGRFGGLSDDALPAEIGVFEIDEDGEAEIGDGEVADHLGEIGFAENSHDFGIDDDEAVDDEVRDQGVDELSFVEDVETFLLIDGVAAFF